MHKKTLFCASLFMLAGIWPPAEPEAAASRVQAKAVLAAAEVPSDADSKAVSLVPEGEGKRFGNVRCYPEERRVVFEGEILMKDSKGDPMELIACAPGGKTHESFVQADIVPSDLHAALREIGMWPWSYPDREAADRADLLGDRAIVWIEWTAGGETRRVRAEDMLLDARLNRPLGRWGWAFAGQYSEETDPDTGRRAMFYRPNREKSLITNYHTPNSVLDNPRSIGAFDDIFVSNTPAVPDVKTRVTVIIEPASEERLVSDNLQADREELETVRRKLEEAQKAGADEKALEPLRRDVGILEARVKWLAGLEAAKVDALREKIRKTIEPAAMAKGEEIKNALLKGDRDLLKKLNAEFELLDAQLAAAWKELAKEYHGFYKSLAESEAEEGRLRSVGEKEQASLDGETEFYGNKEENTENERRMAQVYCEILEARQALDATEDPGRQLEIRLNLAELNRDHKRLWNLVDAFRLRPEVEKVDAYMKAAEKNIADALREGDEQLAAEYRRELEGHKAAMQYVEEKIQARMLRAEAAQLECEAEIHKLKGEDVPDEVSKKLNTLETKALLAEKHGEKFELDEQMKNVTEEMNLEVEVEGDPALIRTLRARRAEIEKRLAELEKEIPELEKTLKED